MICIIGVKGNMGRRYSSICNSLKIKYTGIDINDPLPINVAKYTHYIVSTPTHSHEKILHYLCAVNSLPLKILCEKPIVSKDVRPVLQFAEERKHEIYMVNQYAYYSHLFSISDGETSYDYYNSGGDGLFWDCIQLIYLARGNVQLSNENPIWSASVNGHKLDRDVIDLCYMKMITDFYQNGAMYKSLWGKKEIIAAHDKVIRNGERLNWDSSAVKLDKVAW